ncbi:MAG: mandelate racemase/muconate lactonizing enzyme family protein [Acidobacteria bacterium]|nr:mandelate racemase/muconate lactonizing enzyme family protein [Acidobacteriota bacterium]
MTRTSLLPRRAFLAAPLAPFALVAQQRKSLKITGLETDLTISPPRNPNYDALQALGVHAGTVTLRIKTDGSITGWATSNFGAVEGGPKVVRAILEEEIKPLILNQDPAFPKKIRADLHRGLQYQGLTGVTQFAIAATDIAIWDILGKHAGLPVWRMLGAYRDRMPVYSMCGWYYDDDQDLKQYRAQMEKGLSEGYRAIKIKVGKYSIADDERRIRLALDLAGKDRRVMVDANQVFSRNEALRRGRVYQQMGVYWYEEPLPPHDMEGYAELARELDIRLATGENLYTKYQFNDLIQRRGADIVQPDNRRAGGVTEWLEIAAIADAAGLSLASHGGGDANMNMLCAIPNAIYMETGGPQPRMVDGEVTAPEVPGMATGPR